MRLLSSTLAIVLILGVAQPAFGQSATRTENPNQESPPPPPQPSRIYYGGTLGFNLFGDVFRMSVQPLVGYKLSEKFSVGAKVGYEYIKDKRFDPSRTYHNYGASVFARYRFIPRAYFHTEFAELSFDYTTGREWIPFLLVGGGIGQQVGPNTWIFAEVLFDVLQSSKSTYNNWEPWISIGVGVGF
jgi:hypothetical protein